MKLKIYKNTEFPPRMETKDGKPELHSIDVVTMDELNLPNIGFYNYDTEKWSFHTDTLIDPYEGGKLIDFVWMYIPKELKVT